MLSSRTEIVSSCHHLCLPAYLHLFPNINATVKSLYSLPALPLTVGFRVFSRYMNKSARRITFCVTCVVDKIVTTHFRNASVGMASGASRSTRDEFGAQFSAFRRVSVVSNQKRQVNWCEVSIIVTAGFENSIPVLPTLRCSLRCCSPMQVFAYWGG